MATPANPLVPIAPDVEEQRRQTSLRQAMLQEQARREAESRMTALTQEQAASEAQRRQMGQQHLAGLESQQAQLTQRPSLKQSLIQAGAIAAPAIIGGITGGAEEAGSALQGSAGELESERTYRRSLLDKLQQQAEVERGRQETEQFQGGELARRMEQQTLAERIRDMDLSQRMGMQGDLGYGRQEQQEYATQMRDIDVDKRLAASTENIRLRAKLGREMPEPGSFVPITDKSGATTGWFNPKSGRTVPFTQVAKEVSGGDTAMPMKPGQLEERMGRLASYASDLTDETTKSIQSAMSQLGPVAGRWRDFTTGKIGLQNVDYTQIKTWMTFLASAMTLAHSQGRVVTPIFNQFEQLYNNMDQDPQNALEALRIGKQAMAMVQSSMLGSTVTPTAAPQQAPAWQPPPGAVRVK